MKEALLDDVDVTTVLVDQMDNRVWCTYGPAPNNAYLIGPDGTVIEYQGWYNPALMRESIEAYLNPE